MKNGIIVVLVAVIIALGVILNSGRTGDNTAEKSESAEETTVTETSSDSLSLANSGLKSLSQDVFNDRNLTELDVSGNQLTGALPAEIRMLNKLEVLDASDNLMTGIPAEIGQLSKLRVANFANNDISGLPLEIGNLKNLETLDLRGNPNVSTFDLDKIRPEVPNAKILVD